MCFPDHDEINALLRAADDLKTATAALEASYQLLAGVPLITAKVQLPQDFHDDRPMFYDEDDPLQLAELEKRLRV